VESQPYTLVFLESPYRIVEALEDILLVLGDRRVCVAREMTKMFEEYWRGTVSAAIQYFKAQPARGEFTLVVDGQKEDGSLRWSEEQLQRAIENELKNEKSAKEISTQLAESSGWSKREIYAFINNM
jgi:16S rRNA (cytidine1402-2'-O)-methyltransferase